MGSLLHIKGLYTRLYTLVLLEVSHPPKFEKLEQQGDPFGRPLGFVAADIKYLKRRKNTPTRFYKEQEHTAEALEVHHAGSSTTFFLKIGRAHV